MPNDTIYEKSIPNRRMPFNRRVYCALALNDSATAVDTAKMPVVDGLVKPNCRILITGSFKLGSFGPDAALRRLVAI